jgi:hypothetical protein
MTNKRLVPFVVVLVILLGLNIFQYNQLKSVKSNYGVMSERMFLSLRWFEWNSSSIFEDMQKDSLKTQFQAANRLGETLKHLEYAEQFFSIISVAPYPIKTFQEELNEWNNEIKAQLFSGQPLTDTQKQQAKQYQGELSHITLVVSEIMQEYNEAGSIGNAIIAQEKKLYDLLNEINNVFSSAQQTKTQ